jgi:hypothetical protein
MDVALLIAATRQKYRFDSPNGKLSIEDLWDLPLTSTTKTNQANLDDIGLALKRQLKETSDEESLVRPVTRKNTDLQNKFEIVKSIITIKMAERDEAAATSARKAEKQKLLEILDRRQDKDLENLPVEDLKKRIAEL